MFAKAWLKNLTAARSILLGLLVVLTAAGCGERGGRVSGTVSYGGRPLPEGTVLLLASDGRAYDAPIEPDGRFTLPDVAVGEAKVSVTSLATVPASRSTGPARDAATARRLDRGASALSRIPVRYGDLAKSGLSVNVEANTVVDLNLR